MSNMNHSRPHLKNVDNYKREIAELDSQFKPARVTNSKAALTTTSGKARKRPVSSADRAVHVRACEVLAHMQKHNDISLCNKLVDTLNGARKTALIEWFCEFGRVTTVDPRTNKSGPTLFYAKHRGYLLNEADSKPFWEFMPGIKVKPINLREEILKLIVAAERCLTDEIHGAIGNANPILLSKLKEILKTNR